MPSPKKHNPGNQKPLVRAKVTRSGRPSVKGKKTASVGSFLTPNSAKDIQERLLETITHSEEHSRSPEGVAMVCVEEFLEGTTARGMGIFLQDEQTRAMRCLARSGGLDVQNGKGLEELVREVAAQTAPLVQEGVLVYPLRCSRRLEGALVVEQETHRKKFDPQTLSLIGNIAGWLSVGLDHARLVQKYVQKIIRLQYLEEVSVILNSPVDEEEMLRRAMELSIRLVDAEAGALLLLKVPPGELAVKVVVGEGGQTLESVRRRPGAGIKDVQSRIQRGILAADVQNDPRFFDEFSISPGLPVRTLLSVPIRVHGKTIGILEAVNKREHRPFSNWDLMEFSSLSNQIGTALEHLRLLRQL